MFGLGMPEILLILAIALIVIGPQKLPEVAKMLGKAMGEFKRSAQDLKDSIDIETTVKEAKPKPVKTKLKDAIKDIGTEDPKPLQTSDKSETPDKAHGLKAKTPPESTQDSPDADTPSPASPETETPTPKE
ncbi:Sec-independent protein translocase TatA [Desulfobacter hydrogenophilus]|uniref:Sec-independent protein translocase protein TatA n=1 Tax=Desulfobacter hydrogenophilus TaxID=2291 RepID=A0A328FE42_9BACT|nr:twin-arginine translocase TatA/TatE family subunit [Desulfobacter hydrogenophilus]NDY71669.1 Sec-independent protein translocase TatA [Desulfobacter hydrogenophilus]QBH13183.1 Sec-independent protein translocase TatA [Desulfobacter hydrogenophilus]RAM02396.1 Sec-independent protein translocase TatA [Desulfobacter hydrogenophilus]